MSTSTFKINGDQAWTIAQLISEYNGDSDVEIAINEDQTITLMFDLTTFVIDRAGDSEEM